MTIETNHPIVHYDIKKGVKYVNNIPFLEQKDIDYLKVMIPRVEKLAKECELEREFNKKTLEELERDFSILKDKVNEITLNPQFIEDRKYIEAGVAKYVQWVDNYGKELELVKINCQEKNEKFWRELEEEKKAIEIRYEKSAQFLKEHEDKLKVVESQIAESKKLLRNIKIWHFLKIGLIINFASLIIFYSAIWAKNQGGKLLIFAFRTINLTGSRNTETEI